MPVKKDGTGRRWVEMEIVTPGTPEQVWTALATGPGNAAWFVKADIEEHVGGAVRFDFGANGSTTGEVTAWEPPRRFGYVEREWSPGAPPVATEITITSRGGDRCVIRMVHSLFTSADDWDDQMEGFENGWPAFFAMLQVYLSHHAGKPAATFSVMANVTDQPLAVWTRVTRALGLDGANAGEHRTLAGPETLAGTVARVHQDNRQWTLVVHLESPGPGAALIGAYDAGGQAMVQSILCLYGDDAAARATASAPRWRDWLPRIVTPADSRQSSETTLTR